MNKYFKPLDWEVNDYISYINEPSTIDLSPYLNYIVSDYSEKKDYKTDKNSLGYKAIYNINPEGDNIEIPKFKKESKLSFSFSSKEDFKNTMLPIYENILLSKGLDPGFAKSLVAQDGLESAWGSKPSGDNNFGGIKGKGKVLRTREVENGKDVYKDQEFRSFASLEDYAKYKVNLLDGNRYKAFDGGLEDFSRRVSAGGYATDPRYKEVLDRVIRSVRNGGILKFQQAGKFIPDVGDATRVVNWSGLKLTGGRPYNEEYIDYIYNRLLDYGYDYDTVSILVGNILEESGGDPYARDGQFKGILQWEDSRYKIKDDKDPFNELDNQLEYLHNTLGNLTDKVSWTHGGPSSGYMSNVNARDAFLHGKDISTRNHGLSFGYVRPHKDYKDRVMATNNRLNVVNQVLDRIK